MQAFIPLYLSYILSNFNLFVSLIVLKTILMLFTFATAVILFLYANRLAKNRASFVFFFTILNPAILIINYIFVQLDIMTVFFVLMGYYVLKWNNLFKREYLNELFGLFAIFIAIFMTYFAILLIPTLIYFSKSYIKRLRILSFSALYFSVFYEFTSFFIRGPYDYINGLSGNTVTNHGLIDLQHFIAIPSLLYIIITLIIALLLPLILRKYGYNELSSLFLVLMFFIYVSPAIYEDNFLWIYPLAVIFFIETIKERSKTSIIILLNSLIFVGVTGLLIYDSTGYSLQQGIFYFGYLIFKMNILLLNTTYLYNLFFLVYNFAILISILISVIVIIIFGRTSETANIFCVNNQKIISKKKEIVLKPKSRVHAVLTAIIIIAILFLSSVYFNNVYPNLIQENDVRNAPVSLLSPGFVNVPGDLAMMDIKNNTFWVQNNNINLYKLSKPINFSRNLTNEYIHTSITENISVGNSLVGFIPLLKTSLFTLGYNRTIMVDSLPNETLHPVSSLNLNNSLNVNTGIVSVPIDVNYFSGNSNEIYKINNSLLGKSILMLFKATNISKVQSIPLYFRNNDSEFEIVLSNFNQLIYSMLNSNGQTSTGTIYFSNDTCNGWNYVSLLFGKDNVTVGLDGQSYTFNTNFQLNGTELNVGVPWLGAYNYSFIGYLSKLYISSSLIYKYSKPTLYLLSHENFTLIQNIDNIVNYTVQDSSNWTSIKVDNSTFTFDKSMKYIVFGKLVPGNYSLNVTFKSLYLTQASSVGWYLVPIFFSTVIPYSLFIAFFIMIFDELKKLRLL